MGRHFGVDNTWRDHASCRFERVDLFFPAGTTGAAIEEIDAAKGICQSCRVQDRCLSFAFETNQEDGIWGGTTEEERRKLRREWLADQRRRRQVNA
jgi:WhiB family redox-sensing transcriptional regulator